MVYLFVHGKCYDMSVCVQSVCGVCLYCVCSMHMYVCGGAGMRCKRDIGAHNHGVLEYSGYVRKPGLVLKLPCLSGESRSITVILSECSLWAIV